MKKSDQVDFFQEVYKKSGLNRDVLAATLGMVRRSYSDWVTGKTLPTKEGVELLCSKFEIEMPEIVEEREEWWSGRVNGQNGAKAKFEKYGYFGRLSIEAKIRGGKESQRRRRESPEYYRSLGCNTINEFITPNRNDKLAELVGIVLGDGGITKDQCQICLNYYDDREFSRYVVRLISELFGYVPSIVFDRKSSVRKVVVSGVKFVKLLVDFELKVGNKVRQQVDIPDWIKTDINLYRSCIRGLFDTDGGTFTHRHWCGGHKYRHFGLTFTSASVPLLESYSLGLNYLGIKHRRTNVNIFIDNLKEVKKFYQMVKPSNKKHWDRYTDHLSKSTREE